jgi:hypothetical protein
MKKGWQETRMRVSCSLRMWSPTHPEWVITKSYFTATPAYGLAIAWTFAVAPHGAPANSACAARITETGDTSFVRSTKRTSTTSPTCKVGSGKRCSPPATVPAHTGTEVPARVMVTVTAWLPPSRPSCPAAFMPRNVLSNVRDTRPDANGSAPVALMAS